jgi:hypothetical protein
MVRVLVAALVEVGHGRLTPEAARDLLESGDRGRLPVEAAPPHGLYLVRVLYDGDLPEGVPRVPRGRGGAAAAAAAGGGSGGEGGEGEGGGSGDDEADDE